MSTREAPNPRPRGGGSDGESPSAPQTLAGTPPVRGFLDEEGWPVRPHEPWAGEPTSAGSRVAPLVERFSRPSLFRRPLPTASEVNVRRARRVVRHVDLWSVFRFSLLLYATFLVVATTTGIGLWVVAANTGAIAGVERFIDATLVVKNFHLNAIPILLGSLGMGIVLVFMGTGLNVLMATFYNLISDLVGGVELTVIEEEPVGAVV